MIDCNESGTNRQACFRVRANELSVPKICPSPSQMTRMLSSRLRSISDSASYSTADSSCCVSIKVKTCNVFDACLVPITFALLAALFPAESTAALMALFPAAACLRAVALSDFTVTVRMSRKVTLTADTC